jgi:hypothetical protein
MLAGRVPDLPAGLTQRVAGPLDHGERVGAHGGGGTAGRDHPGDPRCRVGADQLDLLAARKAKRVEEAAQRRGVMPGRRPHQPASIVVDHHRQVPVAHLVGDLVDADPGQPREPVAGLLCIATTRVTIRPTVAHPTRSS